MKKVKYVRWSSIGQNADRQLLNEKFFDKIYQEQVSGVVSFENRVEGSKLLADIRNGKVGELYVDEVSRIGRDSLDCMKTLKVCEENKVNVVVENMGIASLIDGKPNSVFKIITGILSTMAENEKQNIRERTTQGKIAARNRGVVFGKPMGYKESMNKFMAKPKVKEIYKLLTGNKKLTIDEIVRLSNSSLNLVYKVKGVIKKQTLDLVEEKTIKPAKVKVNKVLELLDEPKKEKLSPEDKWKLEALEAQLAWVKSSVIPIPNKKG
jgi:DNA invertase Pin-like site-specific DNA recombinase